MKHVTLRELEGQAHVLAAQGACSSEGGFGQLSRKSRLERWAGLLEAHQYPVNPFYALESLSRRQRRQVRDDGSPLAVAFADPMLRAEGLLGDTIGDGMAFFELSDHQIHRLFCDCHYHGAMTGNRVASQLREIAARTPLLERVRELWRSAIGAA